MRFEDTLTQLANQFGEMLQEKVVDKTKTLDVEILLPVELTQQELAKLFGCSVTNLSRYTRHTDFPRIYRGKGRHIKYPRDAVRAWYADNWHRCL